MKRKFLSIVAVAALAVVTLASCKKDQKSTEETTTEQTVTPEQADESNAKTSLDWAGIYKGTTPCADCPGIDETIELNSDGTFKLVQHYQDKKDGHFEQTGTFEWDATGNKMTLIPAEGEKVQIAVQENALLLLDQEGNVIEGPLADKYRLAKQ